MDERSYANALEIAVLGMNYLPNATEMLACRQASFGAMRKRPCPALVTSEHLVLDDCIEYDGIFCDVCVYASLVG